MDSTPEKTDSAPRRRAWLHVLYVCFLAAGVFAAWQIHVFMGSGTRPGPARPSWTTSTPRQEPAASEPTSIPAALAAGLESCQDDPGGILPPDSAERLYGFRRVVAGMIEHSATYKYPGELENAAQHYTRVLRQGGFAGPTIMPGTRQRPRLVFLKDQTHATVALRKDRRDGKMTMIVVTTGRPAPR